MSTFSSKVGNNPSSGQVQFNETQKKTAPEGVIGEHRIKLGDNKSPPSVKNEATGPTTGEKSKSFFDSIIEGFKDIYASLKDLIGSFSKTKAPEGETKTEAKSEATKPEPSSGPTMEETKEKALTLFKGSIATGMEKMNTLYRTDDDGTKAAALLFKKTDANLEKELGAQFLKLMSSEGFKEDIVNINKKELSPLSEPGKSMDPEVLKETNAKIANDRAASIIKIATSAMTILVGDAENPGTFPKNLSPEFKETLREMGDHIATLDKFSKEERQTATNTVYSSFAMLRGLGPSLITAMANHKEDLSVQKAGIKVAQTIQMIFNGASGKKGDFNGPEENKLFQNFASEAKVNAEACYKSIGKPTIE